MEGVLSLTGRWMPKSEPYTTGFGRRDPSQLKYPHTGWSGFMKKCRRKKDDTETLTSCFQPIALCFLKSDDLEGCPQVYGDDVALRAGRRRF
ncbi:hypothetical protein AVEN_265030-1 [Araneus ventricosus]|uniref:Uncharacterized protein n=1 Tax=Araneus ventricosus TaxID=182803 RepID=A0A4Y2EHF6_ARAVE|nr:hypothetical protein AVEN_265030-1 [Araneus ventricosus]